MKPIADNKFYKQPYSDSELKALKKEASLKRIFGTHFLFSIPLILGFILFSFIPSYHYPHAKVGYIEMPSSFSDYMHNQGGRLVASAAFIAFLLSLTTIIDFIRVKLDISFNFKKVGKFEVLEIVYGDAVKVVKLKGGHKVKITLHEHAYDEIKEQDIVEIYRTPTNKLIKVRILT